uniref:Uncharacterized protein n=2 Tax=Canis lupus familiaris TaxID=9615 RepID=A0A8C0MTX8_CANLF
MHHSSIWKGFIYTVYSLFHRKYFIYHTEIHVLKLTPSLVKSYEISNSCTYFDKCNDSFNNFQIFQNIDSLLLVFTTLFYDCFPSLLLLYPYYKEV